jgi:hypothetical protein
MATIRLCDWLKTRIGKNEKVTTVTVGDKEFEVGEAGLSILLSQFEGEELLDATRVEVKVVAPPAPAPLIDLEVKGDPFVVSDSAMVQTDFALGPESVPEVPETSPLEIPDDPVKRFKAPTRAQADEVVRKATKFEEGSLPALTMGAKAQREAAKKLRAVEEQHRAALKRKGGKGINVDGDVSSKPGFYTE